MKLEEAIENGQELLRTSSREKSPDSWDALKLLIEAGKEIQRLSSAQHCHRPRTLPGETKE